MKRVINFLHSTKEFQDFSRSLKKVNSKTMIKDSSEETAITMILDAFFHTQSALVVVAPNLFKAQQLYDKLSMMLTNNELTFFPQDEFVTSEMLVSSNEFKMERINAIQDILNRKRQIIITHTAGILKPQMPKEKWEKAVLRIISGYDYSLDVLLKTLIQYGFKREYTVEKPGDFSLRGGILDIFPLNVLEPYRFDFFGETVETIKTFDIESQRSIKGVPSVQIYPLFEFFYTEDELNELINLIDEKCEIENFSQEALTKIEHDKESLKQHNELDRLGRYIPFVSGKQSTILDLLEKKILFFVDYTRVLEQYELMKNEVSDWYTATNDYPKMGFEMIYDLGALQAENIVYFDYMDHQYAQTFDETIHMYHRETNRYEGDFMALKRDLSSYTGKTTVLLAVKTSKIKDNLIDWLENEGFVYQLIGSKDVLFEKTINVIVSDEILDVNFVDFGLVVITERGITKKQNVLKKGKYVSVYQNTKRLSSVNDLKPGDFVVHYDYGIGKFIEIKTMELGTTKNDYIHIEYRDSDKLYIPIDAINQIQKYAGSEGFAPRLSKLGGTDWAKTKQRVRSKVKDIADKLISLYANREKSVGFAFSSDTTMQAEFESDFEYEETPDQIKAVSDVKRDMEMSRPMDRLLCGDVGFGKTEVALRAAFKAVVNNKQVAYLAPTTVLSKQHYQTFSRRMEQYGINVAILNRFVTRGEQMKVLDRLKTGSIDVLIGTHRILSKDVIFKDLGLLVIDEEQRFGVEHKEKIKELKINVDVLSLSATPIPRTLQMAMMGVKSMSLLETAPENRYPIQTYVLERNETIIKDAIERELARKGQIFYIYNRVDDIELIAVKIRKLVPEARIRTAHGQMNKTELESVVEDFINQKIDVLISTTIIETGIDIPNANTLIIHEADRLGLAQLYQIRGRVGRSNRIAYAYLMYTKNKILTEDAEKRLKVIKEFTELGSGFKIAIRDLSIRGAGDVLGSEQSGFIDSVGVELYMKILKEEIASRQGATDEPEKITKVKAQVSKYIDKKYIGDDFVKMEMHDKINGVKSIVDIHNLESEFIDRFGRYTDELEIYMYEKLFEKLSAQIDVEKMIETKTSITLLITPEGSKKIAGDKIFASGMKISKYLRFAYKTERIYIILDTVGLHKHWLYTVCEFLESIA
ncbi:MAG: transcription-repair coupling factor [Candidatus Izemoplasmatales bacterium]|nr:transcription-repair coupling factor [Candidatus Izemoplasmatales bacterium]